MNSAAPGQSRRERWLSVFLSLLVHGAVVGVLGWGYWHFRAPRPVPQQLAIEATVVLDRAATTAPAAAPTAPAPTPTPEPEAEVAKPAPTPEPDPAALAAQRLEQKQREQQAAEQRQADQAREHRQQQRAEEQAQQEQERREQAAAEQRRQQQEAAAARAREAADRAAKEKAQRVAQDKARREAELKAQLAAEERVNAARGSAEEAAWLALIRDRVKRAWITPPSARAGVNCEVHVTQVPGGVVTGVQIGSCNGDAAVRESIEAAVYRASPLPTPSNPDLFDRNLKFNFHPDE